MSINRNRTYNKLPFFYGWIVLAIAFLGLFASLGLRSSVGAYVTSWENTFALNRSFITAISALGLIVYGFLQPLTGKMNDRFGARSVLTISLLCIGIALICSSFVTNIWALAFFYGVLASIGISGASNVTATFLAVRWFEKHRGLAIGIVLTGLAAGQLIIVPASIYLIEAFDWRFPLLVFGLFIGGILAPLAFFLVRSYPRDIGLVPYGHESSAITEEEQKVKQYKISSNENEASDHPPILSIFKDKWFWALCFPYFICGFTDLGLIGTHLIPYAEGKGFLGGIVAVVFSFIAIFNILGTLSSGYLSDRLHRGKLLAGIYAFRGLTLILLMTAESPLALLSFGIIFGVTEAASIAPTSALSASLFKSYSFGVVLGVISVSHQLGAAVGSFLPGVFYDLFGSYSVTFIFSIAMLVVSSVVLLRVPDQVPKQEVSSVHTS